MGNSTAAIDQNMSPDTQSKHLLSKRSHQPAPLVLYEEEWELPSLLQAAVPMSRARARYARRVVIVRTTTLSNGTQMEIQKAENRHALHAHVLVSW